MPPNSIPPKHLEEMITRVVSSKAGITRRRLLQLIKLGWSVVWVGWAVVWEGVREASAMEVKEHIIPWFLSGYTIVFGSDPHFGAHKWGDEKTIEANIEKLWNDTRRILTWTSLDKVIHIQGWDFASCAHFQTPTDMLVRWTLDLFNGIIPGCLINIPGIGNHDASHPDRRELYETLNHSGIVTALKDGELAKWNRRGVNFGTEIRSILWKNTGEPEVHFHEIMTGSDLLHRPAWRGTNPFCSENKKMRNQMLDYHIEQLNTLPSHQPSKVTLLLSHNPDGFTTILDRIKERQKMGEPNLCIKYPVFCFSWHTHGSLVDIPGIRDYILRKWLSVFGNHYNGLYTSDTSIAYPKDTVGTWWHLVSSGLNGSPGHPNLRLGTTPSMDIIKFV